MKITDDYICLDCNKIFEYEKPYKESFPQNPECPLCHNSNTKRKITARGTVIPDYMRSYNG